jgi:hypothetical protein
VRRSEVVWRPAPLLGNAIIAGTVASMPERLRIVEAVAGRAGRGAEGAAKLAGFGMAKLGRNGRWLVGVSGQKGRGARRKAISGAS